jgi:hypothetical protein
MTDEQASGTDVPDDNPNFPPDQPALPLPGDDIPVPEDEIAAGHDSNDPQDNASPESLDEEISQGANREDIDSQHSFDRPAVDTIDKEELGAA